MHLLVLIIKLVVVDSSKDLSQFDFKEKENGLPLKGINMWFAAKRTLSNLHKQDKITLAEVKLFRQQCGTFLTIILSKMFEKSPLSSGVKNKACLILENLLKKKSFLISQWWKICFIILCLSSLVCCIYISFFLLFTLFRFGFYTAL